MVTFLTLHDVLILKMPFSRLFFFWSPTGWPGNALTGDPQPRGGGLEKGALPDPPYSWSNFPPAQGQKKNLSVNLQFVEQLRDRDAWAGPTPLCIACMIHQELSKHHQDVPANIQKPPEMNSKRMAGWPTAPPPRYHGGGKILGWWDFRETWVCGSSK